MSRILMSDDSFETLLVQEVGMYIIQVTLNRPEVRNAINSQMMRELHTLWVNLTRHSAHIRCIILTGQGDKAFCAGADLKERAHISLKTWQEQHIPFEQAMLAMLDCPIPIIAAVNGTAFGGGLELVLGCDFAYATKAALFSQSETKLGLMPGAMGTQNLPRACGLRRAKELCLTAQSFAAVEAYHYGIINKLCEPESLLTDVQTTANIIARNAPLAVQQSKKALNISHHTDIYTGYSYELEAYYRLLPTQDREEGIKAFNEKRDPEFIGR